MNAVTITTPTATESSELDELLWGVLWKPLGLPRDLRQSFKIEGEEHEFVAKQNGRVVGGLVAVWTDGNEAELRHLAVASDAQRLGIGRKLVAELVRMAEARGSGRISTIARNTSADFFRKAGFITLRGEVLENPLFAKHGITFEVMERIVK